MDNAARGFVDLQTPLQVSLELRRQITKFFFTLCAHNMSLFDAYLHCGTAHKFDDLRASHHAHPSYVRLFPGPLFLLPSPCPLDVHLCHMCGVLDSRTTSMRYRQGGPLVF